MTTTERSVAPWRVGPVIDCGAFRPGPSPDPVRLVLIDSTILLSALQLHGETLADILGGPDSDTPLHLLVTQRTLEELDPEARGPVYGEATIQRAARARESINRMTQRGAVVADLPAGQVPARLEVLASITSDWRPEPAVLIDVVTRLNQATDQSITFLTGSLHAKFMTSRLKFVKVHYLEDLAAW